MVPTRHFSFVLLGATGYTGQLCAEHIVRNLPTNLKWAIAGRSAEKLNALAADLKKENADRTPPEVLPIRMSDEELGDLARKTKVLINCVGPYHIHSTPVVEACAVNGTHYLDVTGEIQWVKQMAAKYHETAKSTGAIIISANGVESAPADILTWSLASFIKSKFAVLTKDVKLSIYDFKAAGASGGTLSTVLTTINDTPIRELMALKNPYALAVSQPPVIKSTPIAQQLLGAHYIPDIGTVTTSIPAVCDTAIVHRSSSLMPQLFDRNFRFSESMKTRNYLTGVVFHLFVLIGTWALLLPPVRWGLEKIIFAPGQGPSVEQKTGNRLEYRAIATAEHDQQRNKPIRVLGSYSYEGCPYAMTGLLLAEAAMVLSDSKTIEKLEGGYLTPSILGQEYIDRLERVGVSIRAQILEE